jgi:hypothetical protein
MQKIQRQSVSAADLFVMLDREFRRRQPRECGGCYVQLPFRVDVGAGQANWEVVTQSCVLRCEAVLQDLVQEFQRQYDLITMRE